MAERPILFSGPMVRALLAGTKTQTRRLVKPQPEVIDGHEWWPERRPLCPYGQPGDRLWVRETWGWTFDLDGHRSALHYFADGEWRSGLLHATRPDLLKAMGHESPVIQVPAGTPLPKGKPSIHMPRWASRLTLEVTGVRVERLQQISARDCEAEGIVVPPVDYTVPEDPRVLDFEREAELRDQYRELWIKLNGAESWKANPWVWVVEFKRVEVSRG